MADDPSDEIVIVPAGTRPAGQAESMAPTGMKPPLQDADVSRTRWTLAPVLTSLRARLGTPATWEEPSPAKVVFAALAISAAIAALVLALLPSPTSDETAAVGDQPQLAAPAPLAHAPPFSPLPQTDVAQAAAPSSFYVAARSLACRDAASLQGRRVRDLVRGTSVTVLALAGEWDSISYLGRQCWVLARYLSPVPPAEARAMPRRELRHACPARRARHPCPNL